MGNCQAVDAAALVVQHPDGKIERMYWPVKAHEVMKLNPGHYVSLIVPIPISGDEPSMTGDQKKTFRYTRVKLLSPSDTLVLGHAYRLLTSQEVKKVLRAKKMAKEKTNEMSSGHVKQDKGIGRQRVEQEKIEEGSKHDRRLGSGSANSRSKTWRPSLKSISESVN